MILPEGHAARSFTPYRGCSVLPGTLLWEYPIARLYPCSLAVIRPLGCQFGCQIALRERKENRQVSCALICSKIHTSDDR